MEDKIIEISKYSGIALFLIFIISYINQFIYYNYFGIDLSKDINIQEIILLLLKPSLILIVIVILSIPLYLFKSKIFPPTKLNDNNNSNYIKLFFINLTGTDIMLFGFIISINILYNKFNSFPLWYSVIPIIIYTILNFIKNINYFVKKIPFNYLIILSIFNQLFFFTNTLNMCKLGSKNIGIFEEDRVYLISENLIKTSKNIIYIGEINGSIYFYDKKKKQSTRYLKNEIKKEIVSNHFGFIIKLLNN